MTQFTEASATTSKENCSICNKYLFNARRSCMLVCVIEK